MGDVIKMKRIHMLSDWPLLIGVVITVVVFTVMMLWTVFVIVNEATVTDATQLVPIRFFFGLLLAGFLIAIVTSSSRFLCVISLTHMAITIRIPFCKKKEFSYNKFRYLYSGGYFHTNLAGLGFKVWYIVIAQRQLSIHELNQLNRISNSQDIVKVRYSRRNYKKLKAILPPSLVQQLEKAVSEITRQ
jgi:hypothetical protein